MRGRAPFPATWWTQPSSDRAQHLRLGPRGERHGPTAPGSRSRGSGGGGLLRVDMRTETKRKQVSGVVRDALAGHAATSESKGEPRPAAGVGATDRCRRRSLCPGGRGLWRRGWLSHRVVTPPPHSLFLTYLCFLAFRSPFPSSFALSLAFSARVPASRHGAGQDTAACLLRWLLHVLSSLHVSLLPSILPPSGAFRSTVSTRVWLCW